MLRPKLNRVWASTTANTRRDPGDAKYIQGWISEIPTFQVLNYLQYKIDTTLLALAERGVFEWGSDIQYGLNSLVWDETNKTIYISTVGSPNKTQAPSANPTQWVASSIQVSRASYDAVVANINAHIADITGNPHKLTAGRLGAYNKTEIDNIIAQYRALTKAHVDDKNNPHDVTALSAGAVPSTGGTYSGDVIFNAGVWFDANKVNGIIKTGGIYMKNGTGQIGVSDSGVAQVGKTGALSPIVSESTFPALKAAREPDYTVPYYNAAMELVGGLQLDCGVDVVNTNFNPVFDLGRLNSLALDNLTAKAISGVQNYDFSRYGLTVAVDILSSSPRQTDTGDSVKVGLSNPSDNGSNFFIITQASLIKAQRTIYTGGTPTYSGTQYQLTGPINTWYRVVCTFKGNTIKLYLDGVLVGTADAPATASATSGILRFETQVRAQSRDWRLRNFRVWTQELNDKQISTL